jgi:hypothetical protein
LSGSRQIHSEPTDVLRGKSAVYGLNGHKAYYVISLFKVTYKSTIQISRNFNALFTDLREFRYLRLMRASDADDTIYLQDATANGFQVGPYSGVYAVADNSYTVNIIGGTGRFAGATGQLSTIGVLCSDSVPFSQAPHLATADFNLLRLQKS